MENKTSTNSNNEPTTTSSSKDMKHDGRLALGYGSAWHLLRCLGWHRQHFSQQIADELKATSITWLDFTPYRGQQSYPNDIPIRDGEWTRLDFIDNKAVQDAYDEYWPKKGSQQNWDAIGKAMIDNKESWFLVEAKAHCAEIDDKGTIAKEHGGRPQIRAAFEATLISLGYDDVASTALAETWLTSYYQYANRLATLNFLADENAHLIFVYFCGDQRRDKSFCPANAEEWKEVLSQVDKRLGLTGRSDLEKRVHRVFVDVNMKDMA